MNPSVCMPVHYVSRGSMDGRYASTCVAAIITEVTEAQAGSAEEHRTHEVGLCVLNPSGIFFGRDVWLDDGSPDPPVAVTAYDKVQGPLCDGRWHAGGTWHFPVTSR